MELFYDLGGVVVAQEGLQNGPKAERLQNAHFDLETALERPQNETDEKAVRGGSGFRMGQSPPWYLI